jgi:RNA polymerase sigma factor for flagellar operon FliA
MISNLQTAAPARAYRDSTAMLVERFVPMVRKLAWHMHGFSRAGVEPDDLVQAGLVALTECAQRHGGNDADGFAAYAKIRVRGAMIDQLRRFAPISRGATQKRREFNNAESRLRGRLGRDPSSLELAEAMGMEPGELATARAASAPLQFDPLEDAYSDTDMAFNDPSADAFAHLVSEENRAALVDAIAGLPQRLQLVIQLYFVEELNLSEIARILGLSVPRIHQLKDQALQKVKEQLLRMGIEGSD